MLIFCVPCCAILLNAELILLVLRQNPDIARLAGAYCKVMCVCLPIQYMVVLIVRYLQNQNITYPIVISYAIGLVLHLLFNHLFVLKLHLGVSGAAWSQVSTNCCLFALLVLQIKIKNLHHQTWPGWTTASLYNWNEIIRLAIPSILMQCSEWWSFEIGYFLAGLLGEDDLAALVINMNLIDFIYRLPLSISYSVSIRTGNYLGANQPIRAKQVSRVGLAMNGIMNFIIAFILLSEKDLLPRIFTADTAVIGLASSVIPLTAIHCFPDSFSCILSGVLRGCGRQLIGAVVNLVTFYVIGLPLASVLMFVANWGVYGYFIGILVAISLQFIVYTAVVIRLNWQQEADMAQHRAGVTTPTHKELSSPTCDDEGANTEYRDDHNDSPLLQSDVDDKEELLDIAINTSRLPLKRIIINRLCILLFLLIIFTISIFTSKSLTPVARTTFTVDINNNKTNFVT
ncbi:multidrug and toxin extrusion protein 1-like [Glandiceps talaboti]